MADVTISFTIPSDKVATALQGFLKIYPNSEVVSEEDPTPKYTNAQWIKEKIRRIIVKDVRRGLQMSAIEAAQVAEDDSLVS